MKTKILSLVFICVLLITVLGLSIGSADRTRQYTQVRYLCEANGLTESQCDVVISLLDRVGSNWRDCFLDNVVKLTECYDSGCETMYTWLESIKVISPSPNEHPVVNITLIPIDGGGGGGPGYVITIIAPDGGGGTGPGYFIQLIKQYPEETVTEFFDTINMIYETHSIREITLN